MSQVKQHKLSVVKTIYFQKQSYNDLSDLQSTLYQSYNIAANYSVNLFVLNKVSSQTTYSQIPFSLLEMQKKLKICSNISAPGSDHITWWYSKLIFTNKTYAVGILFIVNTYLLLQHQSKHFKKLVSVIISKLDKSAYNTSKIFRPIVLLNILGKLIKKMVARWF